MRYVLSRIVRLFFGEGGSRLSRLMLRVDGRSIRQLVKRNEKREVTIEHARGSKRRERRKGEEKEEGECRAGLQNNDTHVLAKLVFGMRILLCTRSFSHSSIMQKLGGRMAG